MEASFSSEILRACRSHAKKNYSVESCGLILDYKPEAFFPMQNYLNSSDRFELDPKVVLLKNKMKAIFHSHPFSIAYPSGEDMVKSKALGIPYLIYSCIHDNFIYFNLKKCIPMKA